MLNDTIFHPGDIITVLNATEIELEAGRNIHSDCAATVSDTKYAGFTGVVVSECRFFPYRTCRRSIYDVDVYFNGNTERTCLHPEWMALVSSVDDMNNAFDDFLGDYCE